MSTALFAFLVAWKFIAPDAPQVVAMEWKRVLNSPLSAEVRREIPSTAVPVLSGINFIEGIERVVWTPELVALEGTFDVIQLKDMAVADGGVLTQYRGMDLVGPAEGEGTVIGLSPSIVLLGTGDMIRAALDRSEKNKRIGPAGYDLWTRTAGAGFVRHDFGLRLGDAIQISSVVRYASEAAARAGAANASAFNLKAVTTGIETALSATLTPEEFARRQWRVAIETMQSSSPKPEGKPNTIRIYGLDEGVKEIPLK